MEYQKLLLFSIIENRIDRVDIIHQLRNLKVNFKMDADFELLKHLLQRQVIGNLEKAGFNGDLNLASMKKESESVIRRMSSVKDSLSHFDCCLVGCIYSCKNHRSYIRHLSRVHPRESNLVCNYGWSCKSSFLGLGLLLDHLKIAHVTQRNTLIQDRRDLHVVADIPCRCVKINCFGLVFQNVNMLMQHLINHCKSGNEVVGCIFENCEKRFNNPHGLKSHFLTAHKRKNCLMLKSEYRIEIDNSGIDETFTCPENDGIIDLPEEHIVCSQDAVTEYVEDSDMMEGTDSEDEVHDDVFLMGYCDYLNRLTNVHFVPQSTVKIIVQENLLNYTESNKVKEKALLKSLRKLSGISESDINDVLEKFRQEDKFLEAQTKLSSEYMRKKFFQEKFVYVSPVEIVLNPNEYREGLAPKAVIHYIPVVESFRTLIRGSHFY